MDDYWSTEIGSLTRLVYDCKNEIINVINSTVKIKPEYIFCHSGEQEKYSTRYPGYYFIYPTIDYLQTSRIEEQETIINICNTILATHDRYGFFKQGKVMFEFLEKNKVNLYGLSRED